MRSDSKAFVGKMQSKACDNSIAHGLTFRFHLLLHLGIVEGSVPILLRSATVEKIKGGNFFFFFFK